MKDDYVGGADDGEVADDGNGVVMRVMMRLRTRMMGDEGGLTMGMM